MKINILEVGRPKANPNSNQLAGQAAYYLDLAAKKIGRIKITQNYIKGFPENSSVSAIEVAKEKKLNINTTYFLAEWGKLLNNETLFQLFDKIYEESGEISIVIGNAWGWTTKEKDINYISLSPLTFSHEIAGIMLCEQIFRYADKKSGGRYSK